MNHFPVFLATNGRRIVLSGGGDAALAKLRLLLKTEAQIAVYAPDPAPEIENWATAQRLTLHRRTLQPGDAKGAALVYAADEDATQDARTAEIAKADGALINIVDDLENSQFITPAIVDRDPVTIAIGTEGAAPVLARALKADLEARLPVSLGPLARAAKSFRRAAERLPFGRARRAFWAEFFHRAGPRALDNDPQADLNETLTRQLKTHLASQASPGQVTFAIAASADPELLPLKTRNALHEADLVLHDKQIAPEILELARREAQFGTLPKTAHDLTEAAQTGQHVICMTAAPPAQALIAACRAAGVATHIIPGIAPLNILTPMKETA